VEVAADLITAALRRDLSELEQDLTHLAHMNGDGLARDSLAFSRRLPGHAVLLLLNTDGVEALPADRILFHPFLTPVKEPPPALFSAADVFEFQRGDPNGAISALQQASRAADPQIRAEALNRLARNQRKSGRWEEAMRVYAELRALGPINVGGLPAELLARDAMCALFEERGDVTRLKEEASAVYADLGRGRWRISEAAYAYYAGQARQRTGAAAVDDSRLDAVALSEAAQALWADTSCVTFRSRPGLRNAMSSSFPLMGSRRSRLSSIPPTINSSAGCRAPTPSSSPATGQEPGMPGHFMWLTESLRVIPSWSGRTSDKCRR